MTIIEYNLYGTYVLTLEYNRECRHSVQEGISLSWEIQRASLRRYSEQGFEG